MTLATILILYLQNVFYISPNSFLFRLLILLCYLILYFISYFQFFIKFYRVLCYSKLTLTWLPTINPYVWPFSFFQLITKPYFTFWSQILPTIKLKASSFEISSLIAIEALSSINYFSLLLLNRLQLFLNNFEMTNSIKYSFFSTILYAYIKLLFLFKIL